VKKELRVKLLKRRLLRLKERKHHKKRERDLLVNGSLKVSVPFRRVIIR